MTPIQASKKSNEKIVYTNLQDRRLKQLPKFKLGQLVRTADMKRNFSKVDSTNWSFKLYTITEVIDDTTYMILIFRIESTICLRDIIKIYYYQQNHLLMKTTKL